jgi:hypothetical protein
MPFTNFNLLFIIVYYQNLNICHSLGSKGCEFMELKLTLNKVGPLKNGMGIKIKVLEFARFALRF